jgi:hypothetical protein
MKHLSSRHPSRFGRFLVPLALFCAAAVACSFIVNFNQNGQPCSADAVQPCLPNYYCDMSGGPPGVCRSGQAPDSGTVVGPCGGCPAGQVCLANRNLCVDSASCEALACPTGQSCVIADGGPGCRPISGALGMTCTTDRECFLAMQQAGSICVLPAVNDPSADGGVVARPGFCSLDCSSAQKCPPGSACVTLSAASHSGQVSLCLVSEADGGSSNALLHAPLACSRNLDCADFANLTCMVFDNGTLPLNEAVSFCDKGVLDGAGFGTPCRRAATPLPVNGICLPSNAVDAGSVGSLCVDKTDCPFGENCILAEYPTVPSLYQPGLQLRRIDACYGQPSSLCQACVSAAACSADSPHCLVVADGGTSCVTLCTDATDGGPPNTAPCPSGSCGTTGFCSCPP